MPTQEEFEKMSDSEKKKEDWMNSKWRPAMGWMYMAVCVFDFILAPILWAIIQFWETQAANDAFRQWVPITLQGGGLFHVSMCAVLGVSAYGRTQEKLAGQSAVPAGLPSPDLGATNAVPSITQQPAPSVSTPVVNTSNSTASPAFGATGFGSGANSSSSGAPSSFGSAPATPAFGSATITSSSGKPGPVQPDHPEI